MTPALLLLALQAAPAPQRPTVVTPPQTPPTSPATPASPPPAPIATPVEPTVPTAPPPATPPTTSAPPATPPAVSPSTSLIQSLGYPPPAPPTAIPDDIKYRRLVFANLYTLNFGVLFPIPSGDFQFFLGTNLRPRKRARGGEWNTALGYQVTLSVGYADILLLDALPDGPPFVITLFHRHHLMAMGYGGARGRLYYAFGGGAVMWRTELIGVEAEGKLGYVFAAPKGQRVKGVVGGQARLGAAFEDGIPLPQFGLFVGFMVF